MNKARLLEAVRLYQRAEERVTPLQSTVIEQMMLPLRASERLEDCDDSEEAIASVAIAIQNAFKASLHDWRLGARRNLEQLVTYYVRENESTTILSEFPGTTVSEEEKATTLRGFMSSKDGEIFWPNKIVDALLSGSEESAGVV